MIFLFHAKEDEDTAEKIHDQLSEIDEVKMCAENDNLTPTEDRIQMINSSIKEADYILVLFSSHAFLKRRPNELLIEFRKVLSKIKQFSSYKGSFIPIRIDDCIIPLQVRNCHFHQLFEEGGLEQIIRVIANEQEEEEEEEEEEAEGEYLFYKDNWKWVLKFGEEQIICDHRYHTGFTYLHFVLNSGLSSVYIDSLKKVTTKFCQPERDELLGLDEDGDIIETALADREKSPEAFQEDAELFTQISNEIIFAMQSIKNEPIQTFFLDAIQFLGNEFIFINNYSDGKKVKWNLYKH